MYNNAHPHFSGRPPRFQGMSGTFMPCSSNQSPVQQNNINFLPHQQLNFHLMPPVPPSFTLRNHPNMGQNLQPTNSPQFFMRPPPMMLNNKQLPYSGMPMMDSQSSFQAGFNSALPVPRPSVQSHSSASALLQPEKTVSKNPDEIIVEQYLAKIGKLANAADVKSSQKSPSTKLLKICEAKKMHCRAKYLTKKLEASLNTFNEANVDAIKQCKEELEAIMEVLSDKNVIKDLQKKLSKRKRKRERIKRLKEKAYKEEQLRLERIEKASKKINEWQKQELSKLEEQLREEELQAQIDEALVEMRRELSSITKSLDMVSALVNLRKARYKTLKSKGERLPSDAADDHFNETQKEIRAVLRSYKQSCVKKIDALKLFLVAEHEKAQLEIEKRKAKQREEMIQKQEEERNIAMFGRPNDLDPFDPMWPVQEAHKQAEKNLTSLIQYRQLWDQYLHPDGTSIPVKWVEPSEPSSEEWAKYLVKQDANG